MFARKLLLAATVALLPAAASAYTITIVSETNRINPFVDSPGTTLTTFNTGAFSNAQVNNTGIATNAPIAYNGVNGGTAASGLFIGNLLNPALEASPFGDNNDSRGYLAAGGHGGYVDVAYNEGPLNAFAILWGTVDWNDPTRNVIQTHLGLGGVLDTITGDDVHAQCQATAGCSMGNGDTNMLLIISGLKTFDNARFSDASDNSFEYSLRAVNGVPEPSTWAMLILGFAGVVVMGARNRRREGTFRLA